MFFVRNSTKIVDKSNSPGKLYTFTGIVEQKLEYTLSLVSTLEDSVVKYKNEGSPDKLPELKTDIKNELAGYTPEEIINTVTFITNMEGIYNSTNEIKDYIKEALKYPPVDFDLSEVAIKISGIAKKAIDGFFAGNIDTDLESEITETERLINAALRRLHKLNGKENREKGRIVYYSCVITVLKEILEKNKFVTTRVCSDFTVKISFNNFYIVNKYRKCLTTYGGSMSETEIY